MTAGGTVVTPKFAVIDAASSGDNTLVASVSAKKLRVLALFLVSAGTVTVRFESGASGTALTGQMNLVANTGFALPYNPAGWFETAATTLLNLELSAAISVDGALTYIEVVVFIRRQGVARDHRNPDHRQCLALDRAERCHLRSGGVRGGGGKGGTRTANGVGGGGGGGQLRTP